jgi:hypothetical protein
MRTYICKKINENITIDGDIDKLQWQEIKEVNLVDTCTGKAPKQVTTAKMMWNAKFLYVSFHCIDNYIHATMTEYNDKLYEEEVVEIFVDDNGDMKTYIEIEVNPLNTLLHYCVYNNLEDKVACYAKVQKNVTTAVRRHEEHSSWSVEIAIPFSEFITAPHIPPKPGDRWMINLYRIDRPQNSQVEYTAWSPTEVKNYHVPQKFGGLVFSK